jgi:hypothetical protein
MPEPLALPEDLAARLGITFTDAQTDQATAILADASAYVRNYTRQTITQVVDDTATLESTAEQWLWLPQRPVTAVSSVMIGSAAVSPTYWVLQGDGLYRFYGWQGRFYGSTSLWNQPDTIVVTYTHGFAAVPDDIVAVVCKIAKTTWRNPEGLRQWRQGQTEATYAIETVADGALDRDDKRVLDFYRRPSRSVKLSAGIL